MARHFVRSFAIAAALSPFVNAGPCRPSSSSIAVVTTTTETSIATGSAVTNTEESSLTKTLSGTAIQTSLTISESESTTESEPTSATSKTETASTSIEQPTTTSFTLSTAFTTTASESNSSTGTTLATTTTTECSDPEPPVYNDPFTVTNTEELPVDTTEAATTTVDAAPTLKKREFVRRGHPEIVVRDVTTEEAVTTTETAATTSGDVTSTTEGATTTEEVTTTVEDATSTTEEGTTTASETATGCINNMEKPTPEGAVCGERGYVYDTSSNWRYLGEGSSSSVLDCYTSCQQKSNCVTFIFEKDSQCSLYLGTITQLSSDRTTARYYETRCFCDTGIEPAPTCSYDTSIVNGGFDDGKFSPWQEDPNPGGKDPVALRPVRGGEGGTDYRLQTGQFDFDKSMWIYQDVKACPGTRFYCSYRWWWDEYYAIPQTNGGSLVPYVRVYQDDDRIGNRYPTSAAQTKTWINANFQFTVPDSGETRIWFVASSPQGEWINNSDDPCTPDWVHRANSFALDSVYCSS
ncbi:hypothetical protein FLONG3_51 [Fusarium longipes]|uniref:Apple domain-containing protein n=1 Tax=Fusarium longipes TaxID=694270 RepID=A0A395TAS6_9HYPO|nr:hypothetical protein FLONG3_51 [Fusarium longipes]